MIKDDAFFCLARTGQIEVFSYPGMLESGRNDELNVEGPNLNILGRPVEKQIFYPDHLKYSGNDRYFTTNDIVIIPNGIELLQRPRNLIERIFQARKMNGYSKLIYVQGVADPYIVPVLVYAGVQIFDDSYPITEGMNRIAYTIFGKSRVDHDTSEDNIAFLRDEFRNLGLAIRNGTLREVVEKFSFSSKAVEILRILDNYYYAEMESTYPTRTSYIKANGVESLNRPDLIRYRNKISEEFQKPSEIKLALVLPCSARKPYSNSKSHQAILGKISKYRKYLHEIIVTSPVGLVPRELEESYPARFYDIPVIGLWFEEEKNMMVDLARKYFENNHYDKVVAFIPEDLDFIIPALPENTSVIRGGPTIQENYNLLLEKLEEFSRETGRSRTQDRKLESYRIIAKFQFGEWIGKYLTEVKIINSYNQDMLSSRGKILLVYNKELGKFTINKSSGEFFKAEGKFMVEIDDFKPTSNVYAVGVLNCTRDVRQEDEVVLIHNGEVRGVGIAKMPAEAMVELQKGIAVKVRN